MQPVPVVTLPDYPADQAQAVAATISRIFVGVGLAYGLIALATLPSYVAFWHAPPTPFIWTMIFYPGNFVARAAGGAALCWGGVTGRCGPAQVKAIRVGSIIILVTYILQIAVSCIEMI